MKETRADNRAALLQALALHLVLFGLMFAGLRWDSRQQMEAAKGEVVEADLVDPNALSASMQRALARAPAADPAPPVPEPLPPEPLPAPLPEPEPEPAPPEPAPTPPAPVAEPAPVEQERVQRDAPRPPVTRPVQEQEERRRQPDQAELDAQRRLAEIRRQRRPRANAPWPKRVPSSLPMLACVIRQPLRPRWMPVPAPRAARPPARRASRRSTSWP